MRYFRLLSCFLRLLILGAWFGMGAAYAAPFAYISNDTSNNVSVIDTATNTVVATVTVGSFPYGVAVNPAGTFAYVTNTGNNTVSVIDTATNTVVATVTVGTGPRGVAVNPAGTFAYVTNADSNTVSVIDTVTNAVVAGVNAGNYPHGIALNPAGTFAYVANYGSDTVSVIDIATNTVVATVAVGTSPFGVLVNRAGTFAYVTNEGSANFSVIDTATNVVVATVATGGPALGIAVNPAGTFAYVANGDINTVSVIDIATAAVIATVLVGSGPVGIALNPAGTFAYVANETSNTVSVINTASNAVVATVTVGTAPVAFGNFIGPAGGTNTFTTSTATVIGPTNAVAAFTTTYIGPQTIQVGTLGLCTASCTIGAGGTCGGAGPVLTGCAGGTPLVIAPGSEDIDTLLVTQIIPGSDANLSALTISSGSLTPAFAPSTLSYTDTVSNCVASIKVTPTLEDPNASVKVNGVTVTSGTSSSPISLAVGANAINVVVTAQDGTTMQTYMLAVTRDVPGANAPTLQSAVSRKVHGAAGTFDLPLSLVLTAPTTEPRRGPAQTIVFTFDKAINAAAASISEGTATAATPTFSGNDVVVGLTGVSDQQYVTLGLDSVASTDGGSGGCGAVRVGFLLGDVNQNRVVSLADLGLVNAQLAQFVTSANFLKDVNASGTLSVADKAITNANLTRALPAP